MIESAISGESAPKEQYKIENGVRKVLRWKVNERMGGKIPVWEKAPITPKTQVEHQLSQAVNGKPPESFESALSYAEQNGAAGSYDDAEEFGFGDLVDMVNPLQHLPIVGHVYREITGDEIKPIAQIIGGGIFGGPAGIASGLVNTVVEYETGKDLTGNVVAMVVDGEKPQYRSSSYSTKTSDDPQKTLNDAVKKAENPVEDLPGSAISFADLGSGKREVYERVPFSGGRTAGSMIHKRIEVAAPHDKPREPITQVTMSALPLLNNVEDFEYLNQN